MLGKELNKWDEAIEQIKRACLLHREHGTPDTASGCLDRGAKAIESVRPEAAAEFYTTAAEVSMIENKSHQAAEFSSKAARIHLKLKNLKKAADLLRMQLSHLTECADLGGSGRALVCLVLVLLATDDFVAAQRAFNENRVYVEQNELYTMSQLLDGFDRTDPQKIVSALHSPFLKSLDNEITKLVREMIEKYSGRIKQDDFKSYEQQTVSGEENGESDAAALM